MIARKSTKHEKSHESQNSVTSSKKNIYIVEKILEKKKIDGAVRYLIQWKDYPIEAATWEPLRHLSSVKYMIKKFEEKMKKKELFKKNINDENKRKTLNESKISKEIEVNPTNDSSKLHFKINFTNSNIKKKNYRTIEEPKLKKKLCINEEFNPTRNDHMLDQLKNKKNELADLEDEFERLSVENLNLEPEILKIKSDDINNTEGDFRKGDKIKKILFAKKHRGVIMFAIDWEERKNGMKPSISFYDNMQLKLIAPENLIDYYEENIHFKDE